MHAYRIGGKFQSNSIRYRYRHTHIGILSLIIFVDRIDLISLVAYYTLIPFYLHTTDAPKIFCNVKYRASLHKNRRPIEYLSWYPRFRIHYASQSNQFELLHFIQLFK